MSEYIVIIVTLSFLLALSPFLSKVTHFPTTIIEVILGIVAAYIGLLHHNEYFEVIAEIGFLYLMFLAGLEINLKELLKIPKNIIHTGLVYLVLLYMFSAIASLLLSLSAMFILIFSLISIGVVLTLTKDYSKNAPWLKMSLQIGVMGELASIIALTLTSGLLNYGLSFEYVTVMLYLVLTLLAVGIAFYVLKVSFWWFPELKTFIMPHSDNREQDVRLSFSLFFIFISFMLFLDLELALGAFIAGMFISSFSEHKKDLPEKLESFGYGFLIPLFFIHIGSTIDMKVLFIPEIIYTALMITVVMIAIRLISSVVFYPHIGKSGVVLFAFSQAMPLTLMIAVATLAHHANSIDSTHYYAFVLGSIIEVIVVLISIKLLSTFFRIRTVKSRKAHKQLQE